MLAAAEERLHRTGLQAAAVADGHAAAGEPAVRRERERVGHGREYSPWCSAIQKVVT